MTDNKENIAAKKAKKAERIKAFQDMKNPSPFLRDSHNNRGQKGGKASGQSQSGNVASFKGGGGGDR